MLLEADGGVLTAEPVDGTAEDLVAALSAEQLPTDDLCLQGRTFLRFRLADGATVGFGGYEAYGEDVLVRSVIVLPAKRGRGLGREIVAMLLRAAAHGGATKAFLLTTTARSFFESLGFHSIAREDAPAAILATREAGGLCPSTAPLLWLQLTT